MTVRETTDISACCQGVGSRADKIPCFLHGVINRVIVHSNPYVFPIFHYTDIIMEVSRREKEAGIVPDPDIDTYDEGTQIFSKTFYNFFSLISVESILDSNKILAGNISRRTKGK